jgi:hypothetical protein
MFYRGRILLAALGLVGVSMTSARADGGKVLCYLWADQASPELNSPYTPDPVFSFNAAKKQPISVTKVGTGVYNVVCTGDGGGSKGPGGHVQVSGYGPGNNVACHVGEWFSDGSDFFAEVDCFGKGGGTGGGPAPADSKFVLLFIR